MKQAKLLLTGDDGYTSIGIRTLVHVLRDDFELKIAATKEQRSAIGGGVTWGGDWGKEEVEGVEAIWVSGTPADAVGCGEAAFGNDFDLIVSGINMGANVGNCNTSGTMGAAIRSVARQIAPKAMGLSWEVGPEYWTRESKDDDVREWLLYPGETARKMVTMALDNDLWGADILNVNFPNKLAQKARFTQPIMHELKRYYNFDIVLDEQKGKYIPKGRPPMMVEDNKVVDVMALQDGLVSVVPWRANLFATEDLLALVGQEFDL